MAQVVEQPEKDGFPEGTKEADEAPLPPSISPASYPQATTTHSVLDAQLEALALGQKGDLASLLLSGSCSTEGGFSLDTDYSLFKRKGPNSIPGTGSSIASASDHEVSSSDFESDSGIENSHAEVNSPEMTGLPKTNLDALPHDDLAVVAARDVDQLDAGEKSCDKRIDSFIQCLDDKVGINRKPGWSLIGNWAFPRCVVLVPPPSGHPGLRKLLRGFMVHWNVLAVAGCLYVARSF